MDKKFSSIIFDKKTKAVLSEDTFYWKSVKHITPLVESMVRDLQKKNSNPLTFEIKEVKIG